MEEWNIDIIAVLEIDTQPLPPSLRNEAPDHKFAILALLTGRHLLSCNQR
jgi:hypothetical protein